MTPENLAQIKAHLKNYSVLPCEWVSRGAYVEDVTALIEAYEKVKSAHDENLCRWEVCEREFVTTREAELKGEIAILRAARPYIKQAAEEEMRHQARRHEGELELLHKDLEFANIAMDKQSKKIADLLQIFVNIMKTNGDIKPYLKKINEVLK